MILPDVQTVLRLVTFAGDARSDDLRQPINIHGLDGELVLELAAHALAPGLGAEAPVAQRQLAQVDAHGGRDLGDVERVRRRRPQNMRAQILHQHHLPLGAAAGDRHRREPQPTGAVVKSKARGQAYLSSRYVYTTDELT